MSSTDTQWISAYTDRLRRSQFYGKIIIEMRAGDVVLIRREETIKPEALQAELKPR